MKYSYFLCLLICFLLANCTPNEPLPDPSPYWGEATARLNGAYWEAKPYLLVNKFQESAVNLFMDLYDSQNVLIQSLYISHIPFQSGEYQIPEDQVNSDFWTVHGDVSGDHFSLENSNFTNNFIKLTSVDSLHQIVEGQFELSLIRKKDTGQSIFSPELPDTIHFSLGHFRTRIASL